MLSVKISLDKKIKSIKNLYASHKTINFCRSIKIKLFLKGIGQAGENRQDTLNKTSFCLTLWPILLL